jgi:hypothetical protein
VDAEDLVVVDNKGLTLSAEGIRFVKARDADAEATVRSSTQLANCGKTPVHKRKYSRRRHPFANIRIRSDPFINTTTHSRGLALPPGHAREE